MDQQQPQITIEELNRVYQEAEEADKDIFAEMRSNIQLIAGEHYARQQSKFWSRVRDNRDLSNEQKLRLTKNHIQFITKAYVNNITSCAPSVGIMPKNESELQDQKAAELHQAIWQDAKDKHKLKKRTREWTEHFVGVGEVAVKVFWDPMAGDFQGYLQATNENGEPLFDENGQPSAGQPKFTGGMVFEEVLGFNLLRHRDAKRMDESECFIIRKMVGIDELKKRIGDDEDKLKMLDVSQEETFLVFDKQNGSYGKQNKDEVCLREYYYRPSPKYPMGMFYITTQAGILWSGELPFGIFPIIYAGFEELPTTPRARSLIKQLRPYQIEINRAASKMAEHQITLGDDKLLIQNGTKVSQGGQVPGVRAITYTGASPTFLAGRDGSQYLNYLNSQIAEMYQVANLEDEKADRGQESQLDAYTLLYRSLRQKKKFSFYGEKIESFLTEVCEVFLGLARNYYPEDMIIPAIGRREAVNIAEFKNSNKLCYQIKVEPQSDDIETKMGKQLAMNHALQYVGQKLEKEDIGKIMRNMPYGNFEESFSDMTLDYDSGTNIILALDRGEFPKAESSDDKPYMVKRLTARMRQADFRMLQPDIQQKYELIKAQYEALIVKENQEIQAAQAGYIPTGGYLVVVDFYVSDPADPNKTRRARLPYEAIQWLIEKLEQQGSSLSALESMQQGSLAEMARMQMSQGKSGMAPGTVSMLANGHASPGGMNAGPSSNSAINTGQLHQQLSARFQPPASPSAASAPVSPNARL